jgi:hypothetical protein
MPEGARPGTRLDTQRESPLGCKAQGNAHHACTGLSTEIVDKSAYTDPFGIYVGHCLFLTWNRHVLF